MENKYKVVLIKHPNCRREFIFTVPDNLSLKVGDYVLCKVRTNKILQVGKCITSDFTILGIQLKEMYDVNENDLMPVVGYLKPIMYGFNSND